MKFQLYIYLFLLSFPLLAKLIVIDDMNRKIELQKYPKRVITQAPGITELASWILPAKYIVGISSFSNYPPELLSKPRTGSYVNPIFETIISLKPDLLIGTAGGLSKAHAEKFEKLGIAFFAIFPRTLNDIPKTIRKLATVFKNEKIAEQKALEFEMAVRKFSRKAKKYKNKKILYLISATPIMGAAKGTYIDDLLKLGNFTNILKHKSIRYPNITAEYIAQKDPDIILLALHNSSYKDDLLNKFALLKAYKKKQIYTVDPDIFNRPGPRLMIAMNQLLSFHQRSFNEKK